jgi:fructosamine-3-kinase
MVPTFDLTDRKSERSLSIVKNDAPKRSSSAQSAAIASMLHTNHLRKITAGSLASSVITRIFRKIVRVPLTIACTTLDERQVFVLERVHQAPPTGNFWAIYGERLARLRRTTQPQFGPDEDNYLGALLNNAAQEHFRGHSLRQNFVDELRFARTSLRWESNISQIIQRI